MTAFYNEIDPTAAQWLRNLIAAGEIPSGVVDERSISEITPNELTGYTQCHFFAGIGVWPLALRRAGWPDDRPIWTGSCPCQPFSGAGKGAGTADERHLWPSFHWLIDQCRPPVVTGEQVASPDGLGWLDVVSADLERSDYSVGASDLCAAGITVPLGESQTGQWLRRALHDYPDEKWLHDFTAWAFANLGEGAPHIRQRLYFVGLANPASGGSQHEPGAEAVRVFDQAVGDKEPRPKLGGHSASARWLADGDNARSQRWVPGGSGPERPALDGYFGRCRAAVDASQGHGKRSAFDWISCQDGKWRPIESGLEPLADGVVGRVGQLRAYGNALEAHCATRFVEVVKELTA